MMVNKVSDLQQLYLISLIEAREDESNKVWVQQLVVCLCSHI